MNKNELIDFINQGLENTNSVVIPIEYQNDFDVAMAIAKNNGAMLEKMNSQFYANKDIMMAALKSNHSGIINKIDESLYDDKEIVTLVVSIDGHLLWKASDRLCDDIDVVRIAIMNDPTAIRFASSRIKESEDIKNELQKVKAKEELEQKLYIDNLNKKVSEYQDKPIWWRDENIINSEKLQNSVTPELVHKFESVHMKKLPVDYINLLKEQNGGRLIKRYYYLKEYHDEIVFEIDAILGISDDNKNEYDINEYNQLINDYVDIDNVIIFGTGASGGHDYFLFDYKNLNEDNEPKIVYYDEELETSILLANSFKEFISNLKINEAIDLLYI